MDGLKTRPRGFHPFTRGVKPVHRSHKPGKMNGTEFAYAQQLDLQQLPWMFESVTLVLADDVRYTPDFAVEKDGCIEFHEVKGFMRDDSRVKIRVAAKLYPWFRFVLVRKEKGEFIKEEMRS